ncbi:MULTISPECIES: hypothetical protein [Xanthomonas]|uniref:hypothetical protein n=1 Tax=Xanthomonas cannabis TaxID=1885674 RepID=UPI001617009E|nr:hypothetical protein [Xanthomonas campestris pv. zinniae]
MTAWKQTLIVLAMAVGLLVCNAALADHVDMRIVRDYPAGTPAIAQIHAWLQRQSRLPTQPRKTPPPADAAALGSVRISTAIFDRPLNTRADTASNVAPLPARGQPRDEITIDACNGDQQYHWVYVWAETAATAAWQLRSYQQKTVADCKSSPNAAPATAHTAAP